MYEELYKAWKLEKENSELQPLSKTFYTESTRYIKNLREELRTSDEKTLRSLLVMKEFNNVKWLITDLLRLRYQKILENVSRGEPLPTDAFTAEEEPICGIATSVRETFDQLLKEMLEGRAPRVRKVEAEKKPKKILVRFLQAIPAIVGLDMKAYGPFKAEDIASLPAENAEILIKQGIAMRVEA